MEGALSSSPASGGDRTKDIYYPERPLARIAATFSILFGALIVGFNPDRWDYVVIDIPRGHGIHLHELIGVVFIATGLVLFWRRPTRSAG